MWGKRGRKEEEEEEEEEGEGEAARKQHSLSQVKKKKRVICYLQWNFRGKIHLKTWTIYLFITVVDIWKLTWNVWIFVYLFIYN